MLWVYKPPNKDQLPLTKFYFLQLNWTGGAKINFRDFYNHCEALFKRDKNYIIERVNLYNTQQPDRESLETFFLRLSRQAAQCGWAIDNEKEVVHDIFIDKMKFKDIQRDLCIRPGNSRGNSQVGSPPRERLRHCIHSAKTDGSLRTFQHKY